MSEILQILTEYISIILCLHTFSKAKKRVNLLNIIFGILIVGMLSCIGKCNERNILLAILVYFIFLLYVKRELENRWLLALKTWGFMMVTMPSLQLGMYIIIKIIFKYSISDMGVSIIANVIICIFFMLWNENLISTIMIKIRKRLWIIAAIVFVIISVC